MIKRPVKLSDEPIYVGMVVDADGNQIAGCQSREIALEIIEVLNCVYKPEMKLVDRGPNRSTELPCGAGNREDKN